MCIFVAHRHIHDGQMTLPFILLVSGIIIEIAIAGAFVTYFLSTSGYGERLASRAESAARSGINDALLHIMQNKDFSSASCLTPYSYTVSAGGGDTAQITLCRTTDINTNKYIFTVTSIGVAVTHQKKLVATSLVDQTTGQTELESISEQPVEQ
jgi:uncharacterized protein (UPF0333 family)